MLLDRRYRLEHQVTGPNQWPTWSAYDERLGRKVTVLFPVPDSVPAGAVRRYSCLDDGRLVRVLDVDAPDTPGFLVTEAYRGLTLTELRSSGLLTAASAIELVAEAASAVAVVHAAGLAYGSLTTDSICWTDSGLVKLLDVALSVPDDSAQARDVSALQGMLRPALEVKPSLALLPVLSASFGSADELAAALQPFRPADAPLRRSLVSPEPAGAPHRLTRCRVREVMTTDVPVVSEDTPVLEVAEILARCQHAAVPVVDAAGRVTGMISSADLAHWQLGLVSV